MHSNGNSSVPSADSARGPAPGFRAAQWRVLLATMFCYLFYYLGRQTFGFAIPGIQEEFGLSKLELGYAGTGLLWAYAIGQAINGNLGDMLGGRRLMALGAVLSCALNWIVSLGAGLASIVVPWTVNGYAQALGWAPGSRVLSNWWSRHERGMAYGFYLFAAGMSSVLAFVTPLLIIDVLDLGWRWIFRLPVLCLLVGGLVFYAIARDRPADLGFDPPDDDEWATPSNAEHEKESARQRYLAALSNWRFMVASVAIGFQSIARYGLLFWVPVHFLGEDWKNSDDKWVSVALPVGMALGALVSGWLSDRLFRARRWPLISLFMTLAAVSSFAMYWIPREQHVAGVVALFCCGFFAYGPQAAFWALCPDLLGRTRAGTGTGIMNTHAYVFAGIGEPLIGWLIESGTVVSSEGTTVDDTALVFPFVAVACLVSAVIGLFIRR